MARAEISALASASSGTLMSRYAAVALAVPPAINRIYRGESQSGALSVINEAGKKKMGGVRGGVVS